MPALHWRYCQRQAVLVAGVAPALLQSCPSRSVRCCASICRCCACIFPASCWHHCQHCAVVHVTGIVLASSPCCGALLLLLRRHLCPHCLCLVPALQPCVCPVTKQSQHALASLPAPCHCRCRQLPALLPSSHGRFCPCSTGVANLGIPALRQHHELASA